VHGWRMARKLPFLFCVALVILGMWVTGVSLSAPPEGVAERPAPSQTLAGPQNPAAARAGLGMALIFGGGLGAWMFARR